MMTAEEIETGLLFPEIRGEEGEAEGLGFDCVPRNRDQALKSIKGGIREFRRLQKESQGEQTGGVIPQAAAARLLGLKPVTVRGMVKRGMFRFTVFPKLKLKLLWGADVLRYAEMRQRRIEQSFHDPFEEVAEMERLGILIDETKQTKLE